MLGNGDWSVQIEQRFPQQRAFVTGAASGLGLEIGRQLADRGWKLYLADINGEALDAAAADLADRGATSLSRVLNVTRPEELEAARDDVEQAWGGVDLVFNNAGIAVAGELNEVSLQDWQRVIEVDLWGAIHGCRVFAPLLQRQGAGHIINTASSAGILSAPEMAPYNVAKAGVISLSETLKVELGRDGIGVTVICPTVFSSGLGASFGQATAGERMLQKQLDQSKVPAAEIVRDTISAIERQRLYVISQPDGRWGWRMKRWLPEFFFNHLAAMYRDRKGIFAEDRFT